MLIFLWLRFSAAEFEVPKMAEALEQVLAQLAQKVQYGAETAEIHGILHEVSSLSVWLWAGGTGEVKSSTGLEPKDFMRNARHI